VHRNEVVMFEEICVADTIACPPSAGEFRRPMNIIRAAISGSNDAG
jgi:hypothetical protein